MLSRPQPDLTEAQAKLQRLDDMVQRAGNLVHKMRAFGRVEAADIEAVDLRQSIAEAIELCRSELTNHDIQLNTHLPDQPAMVMGVGQMVEQVIVNGLLNARDALRDQAGEAAVSIVLEQEGECWKVRIIDNGPGIPEEIIDRVMEPFFTTKPVNEGTGLGLSLSYGMITGMNGDLEITNIDGGVELRLSLPAAVS
jgi:C4-dicarboxylate-specific signal transduction histidine kinase